MANTNTNTNKLVEVQIIKAENDQVVRFKSSVTPEQITLVQAVKPELLTLKNEDKKPIFKVTVGSDASASQYGVTVPHGATTNFLVDVNVADEVLKYTVLGIAANLEKVFNVVTEFQAEIARAEDLVEVSE